MLGLALTMRVAGPLAGLIVLIYGFFRLRARMIWRAVPYFLVALATAGLSWPYLWTLPIVHYMESLRTMAQFPFTGRILFMGRAYRPQNLPWTYFPTLLSLQLTEPALLLAIAGLVILAMTLTSKVSRQVFLLFLGWTLLPVTGIILIHSIIYDNGRQLYFLLPPIFFLPGVALDRIFRVFTKPMFRIGLLALVALPSIYALIRLHPYEYVYYNILVNGTGGAVHLYEMDYWSTSLKEAVEDVNRVAPQHAKIVVFGGPKKLQDNTQGPIFKCFILRKGIFLKSNTIMPFY
jgi:hypothetical protein